MDPVRAECAGKLPGRRQHSRACLPLSACLVGSRARDACAELHGCYAQFVCVPRHKLVPVPEGLDAAEAVAVVLNYVTAYQMLHRSAKAKPGQRMLIHG